MFKSHRNSSGRERMKRRGKSKGWKRNGSEGDRILHKLGRDPRTVSFRHCGPITCLSSGRIWRLLQRHHDEFGSASVIGLLSRMKTLFNSQGKGDSEVIANLSCTTVTRSCSKKAAKVARGSSWERSALSPCVSLFVLSLIHI